MRTTTPATGGATGANGGNVTMVAYWGNNGNPNTNPNNGPSLTPGVINLPAGSLLQTSGDGTGSNGNVLIIGGAGQPPQVASNRDVNSSAPPVLNAVSVGQIVATGGTGGGGTVTIAAAQPTIQGVDGSISIINGTVQQGTTVPVNGVPTAFNSSFTYTDSWNGSVVLGGTVSANTLTVQAGNSIAVNQNLTAKSGGATLTAYGNGTIGGAGSLTSTGPIVLNLGNSAVTVGTQVANVSIAQNAVSLLVTNSAISSLTVNAAAAITVNNTFNLGTGSLTLDTTVLNPYSSNIVISAPFTANGGVTLTVGGVGTIGGAGTINSSGPIALNIGTVTTAVDIPAASGLVTIVQTGQGSPVSAIIGTAPASISSLSVTSGGTIIAGTAGAINMGGAALSLISNGGNIVVANSITANGGLTLGVQGHSTIGGLSSSDTVNSTGSINLTFGTAPLGLSMSGTSLVAAQGTASLTVPAITTMTAPLYVTSGGDINVGGTSTVQVGGVSGTFNLASTGGIITVGQNIVANTELSLTAGDAGSIGGTGTVSSNGTIAIVYEPVEAQPPVETTVVGGSPVQVLHVTLVDPSAPALNVGAYHNLSVTSVGQLRLFVASPLDTATGSVSFVSTSGEINLQSALTAGGGVTLQVSGGNPINSATNTVSSLGAPVTLNFGSETATVSPGGSTMTIFQSGGLAAGTLKVDTSITPSSLTIGSTGGNIVINSGTVSAGAGGINLSVTGAGTISGAGAVSTAGLATIGLGVSGNSTINTTVGQLAVNSSGGSLSVNQTAGSITLNSSALGNGSLSVNASGGGNINVAGLVTSGANVSLTTTGAGTIGGAGSISALGTVSVTTASGNPLTVGGGTGPLTVAQGATLTIDASNPSTQILILTAGSIILGSSINVAAAVGLQSTTGSITINNNLTSTSGIALFVDSGGTIGGSGTVSTQGFLVYSSANVASALPLGFSSPNVTIGTLNVASPGTITDLEITNGGDITFPSNGEIAIDTNNAGGTISLTSTGGNINLGINNLSINNGASGTFNLQAAGTVSSTGIFGGSAINITESGTLTLGVSPFTTLSINGGAFYPGTSPVSMSITTTNGDIIFGQSINISNLNMTNFSATAASGANNISLANITLSGNSSSTITLTALGGSSLAQTGTLVSSVATGNISSTGTVTLDFGHTNASFVQASQPSAGQLQLSQNGSLLNLLALPSFLTVVAGNLQTSGAIDFGTGSLWLTGNGDNTANLGNVQLGGTISAGTEIRLSVTGSTGALSGNSILTSANGTVALLFEDNQGVDNGIPATLSMQQNDIVVSSASSAGNATFEIVPGLSTLSVRASTVIINSGTTITAPQELFFHTTNFNDSGKIVQSIDSGLFQIDNSGTSPSNNPGLVLTGTPQGITNSSKTGGLMGIFDFNGQTLEVASSYTFDAGTNGFVTMREASGNISVPGYNMNTGTIKIDAGATLTLNASQGEAEVAAPTVELIAGSGAIQGGAIKTTNAGLLVIHTSNLLDAGTISSATAGGTLQIDDQNMNPTQSLVLAYPTGAPPASTPQIICTSSAGGVINVWDFFGNSIDIQQNFTIIGGGAGTSNAAGGIAEIEEVTQGGSAVPSGQFALESTHTAGSIILEPGVTVTLKAEQYVELDAPTVIINSGATYKAETPNEVALESLHLTNNGQVLSMQANGPGQGIAIGDDDEYDTGDADQTGPVTIMGTGTIGYPAPVAGQPTVVGGIEVYSEAEYELSNRSTLPVPSRVDSVNFLGDQTFNLNGNGNIFFFTTGGTMNFAVGSSTTVNGGHAIIDTPMLTINGSFTGANSQVLVQNSSSFNAATTIINNGLLTTSAANGAGQAAMEINSTGNLFISGSGTFSSTGTKGALVINNTKTNTTNIQGSLVFNGNNSAATNLVQIVNSGTGNITISDTTSSASSPIDLLGGTITIATKGTVDAPNIDADASGGVPGLKGGTITVEGGSGTSATVGGDLTSDGFDATGMVGAIGKAGQAGAAGGKIVIVGPNGVTMTGAIQANGGGGGTGGVGTAGTTSRVNGGTGGAGGVGGAGGSVSISSKVINMSGESVTLDAGQGGAGGAGGAPATGTKGNGGAGGKGGAGGAGGKGGIVSLSATSGNLSIGAISATGNGGGSGGGGVAALSSSAVSGASGGGGGNGGAGGNGGSVGLKASGTTLQLDGNIIVDAGSGTIGGSGNTGGDASTASGSGNGGTGGAAGNAGIAGKGGSLSVEAAAKSANILGSAIAISAVGGNGGSGASGGSGGDSKSTVSGKGGNGGAGSNGAAGGVGGTVTFLAASSGTVNVTGTADVSAGSGNIGGTGGGGGAGVSIKGLGGLGGRGGSGGAGGKAGSLTVKGATGHITLGTISAVGGPGGDSGSGGPGGANPTGKGGNGGAGGSAGNGGNGGTVSAANATVVSVSVQFGVQGNVIPAQNGGAAGTGLASGTAGLPGKPGKPGSKGKDLTLRDDDADDAGYLKRKRNGRGEMRVVAVVENTDEMDLVVDTSDDAEK